MISTRVAAFAVVGVALTGFGSPGVEPRLLAANVPGAHGAIIVSTATELNAALSPSNAGQHILVLAGTYELSHALVVPEGATLAGEGVMTFDESGHPVGFESFGRTNLRSTPGVVGDVLTLSNGATARGLVIEDVAGRLGNVVVVPSTAAGDVVSAAILECEIINPNPSGALPQGPGGRGVLVLTRNLNLSADPPPHEGAVVSVQMAHSIVRSPAAGSGVFATNFASHGEVTIGLARNVIGGGLDVSGGVSRPDAVTGARVIVESERNVYRSDSVLPSPVGWQLIGGIDAPIPGIVAQASTFNALQLHSVDDQIKGFGRGISAIAGRRASGLSGAISSNSLDLELHGTQVRAVVTDLALFGARSVVAGVPPGDGNVLHVLMRQVSGSGPRTNEYFDSWNPSMTNLGAANKLIFAGNLTAFTMTNDGFIAPPPMGFFTAAR